MSGAGKAQYLVVVVLPCRASSHVTDSGAAGIASTSSAVLFWYRSGSRATGQGRGGEMAGRAKSCCCCCCCSVQSCWLLQPPLLRTIEHCCHYCCLGSPGPGLLQNRRPFLGGNKTWRTLQRLATGAQKLDGLHGWSGYGGQSLALHAKKALPQNPPCHRPPRNTPRQGPVPGRLGERKKNYDVGDDRNWRLAFIISPGLIH